MLHLSVYLGHFKAVDVSEEGRQVLLADDLHGRAQRAVRRLAHLGRRIVDRLRDTHVQLGLSTHRAFN